MGGYLRPAQIDEMESERRVIENTLKSRDVQDRGNLMGQIKRIDEELSTKAPPDLTGEERDQKMRECQEIQDRLVPLMPSDEAMRRNPPGTVGRHNRFDKAAKSTEYFEEGDLARWKDNMLALNKGDNDPDIANFERFRPLHDVTSMLGAQIPGTQYFGTNPSEAYKVGYDRTFAPEGKEVTSIETSETEGDPAEEVILDPPKVSKRKSARRKKSRVKKSSARSAAPRTEMPCGFMAAPQGRHFHVAKCKTCQEAAEE